MREHTHFSQRLQRLVEDGTLTPAQAAAVADALSTSRTPPRGASRLAEIAVYLGGGLAGIAGTALISQVWDAVPPAGQVATLAGLAGVFVLAGAVVRDRAEPVRDRLAGALWLLAVGLAAAAGGTAADAATAAPGPHSGGDVAVTSVAVAVAGLAVGVPCYLARRAGLQQLAVVAAGLWLLGALEPTGVSAFTGAMIAWSVGVAWLAGGLGGLLPPRGTVAATGGGVALVAAQVAVLAGTVTPSSAGLAVALATAAALVALGAVGNLPPLVAFGATALVLFGAQAVAEWFGGSLAVLFALVAGGVGTVGFGLWLLRRPTRAMGG